MFHNFLAEKKFLISQISFGRSKRTKRKLYKRFAVTSSRSNSKFLTFSENFKITYEKKNKLLNRTFFTSFRNIIQIFHQVLKFIVQSNFYFMLVTICNKVSYTRFKIGKLKTTQKSYEGTVRKIIIE